MIHSIHQKQSSLAYKILRSFIALTFISGVVLPPGYAQEGTGAPAILNLPVPGVMAAPGAGFVSARLIGVTVHPDDPLKFDFIVNTGDADLAPEALKEESRKLIKYFLASLTVPEDELWVNLSPYEKDRMIPPGLGQTEMGRDMLAQDYLLKQLTASLMYPEEELGKKFWEKVYKEAREKYGTTEIPVNTFNKVWVVPQEAVVYENDTSAFVVKSRLKVMLESDYLAMSDSRKSSVVSRKQESLTTYDLPLTAQIIKEVIIPAIEKEVNEGENFACLRQMYNSLILAAWYKIKLKDGLLGKVYVDQNKTKGIDTRDKTVNRKIYDQYIESFKKGVYNYIKEDTDPATQDIIPRKYFSGGFGLGKGTLDMVAASLRIGGPSAPSAPAADLINEIKNGKNSSVEVVLGENPTTTQSLAETLAALEPPVVTSSSPVVSLDGGARLRTSLGSDLLRKFWSPSDTRRKHYQVAQDYKIIKTDGGQLKLVNADRWTKTKTPLSDVDAVLGILDRIKELDALRKKEGDPQRTIRVLDWGAGEGVALIELKEWLNESGIFNVELIGYSDIYYLDWHNAPEGITFIFDVAQNLIKQLAGKKIDLMYSRWGIYHYTLETVGREEVVRYFRDLKGILSPAGEIRSDFFYLEDHEIAASGFDVIAITGKLGTKMYPIKDKVENIDVTNDETRDTSGSFTKGGIDLNPALLDLQIKRDGNGVPLLLPQQPIETMRIDGFVPIIINITPIPDLLLLLGLEKPDDKKHPLSSAGGDKPAGSQIKPFLEKLPKGDASILCAARMASPKVSAFVAWNTRDFMAHGVSSWLIFRFLSQRTVSFFFGSG